MGLIENIRDLIEENRYLIKWEAEVLQTLNPTINEETVYQRLINDKTKPEMDGRGFVLDEADIFFEYYYDSIPTNRKEAELLATKYQNKLLKIPLIRNLEESLNIMADSVDSKYKDKDVVIPRLTIYEQSTQKPVQMQRQAYGAYNKLTLYFFQSKLQAKEFMDIDAKKEYHKTHI